MTDSKSAIPTSQLLAAAAANDLEGVKKAIAERAHPNTKDEKGHNALHLAVFRNNKGMVAELIAYGVKLDEHDKEGLAPLHYACALGYTDVAIVLAKAGADKTLRARRRAGHTPLGLASISNKTDTCAALLANGFQLGPSDFVVTCTTGPLEEVRALVVTCGADPNAKNEEGRQGIHEAAVRGKEDIVRFLVEECGVDPDAKDVRGHTPLMMTSFYKQNEAMKFLLSTGRVNVNATDGVGVTALYLAVGGERNPETIRLLLAAGADSRLLCYGQSAAEKACRMKDLPVLRMLLAPARSEDWAGEWGRRLMDAAADGEHEGCFFMIIEAVPFAYLELHDATIASGLESFVDGLRGSTEPIQPQHRVLWWTLLSPAVANLPVMKAAPPLTAATVEEANSITAARLQPLRDDAWKRRRHLTIARDAWKRGYRPGKKGGREDEDGGEQQEWSEGMEAGVVNGEAGR
jgi:ankyrin repeat protein